MVASNDGPLPGSKAKENGQSRLCPKAMQGLATGAQRVSVAVGGVSAVHLANSISVCLYRSRSFWGAHVSWWQRMCESQQLLVWALLGV